MYCKERLVYCIIVLHDVILVQVKRGVSTTRETEPHRFGTVWGE